MRQKMLRFAFIIILTLVITPVSFAQGTKISSPSPYEQLLQLVQFRDTSPNLVPELFAHRNKEGKTTSHTLFKGQSDFRPASQRLSWNVPGHVDIVEDEIFNQDFVLELNNTYKVSGVVVDSLANWPLYALIDIDGYPNSPVWTDPITGEYEIHLIGGADYTFNVSAWVNGYMDKVEAVGSLSGDLNLNFELEADLVACSAPGYAPTDVFFDNFESGSVWSMGGLWNIYYEEDPCGDTVSPFPSLTFASYFGNQTCSYDIGIAAGSMSIGIPVVIPDAGGVLSYWSYEETECGGSCDKDKRYTEVSIDNRDNWITLGEGHTEGVWHQRKFDLAPYTGEELFVRFRFDSIDDLDNDYFGWMVDDVAITSCEPIAGSLIVGNVYDANTGAGLVGASVSSISGYSITTEAIPSDPNVPDGFYTLFGPEGGNELTAQKSEYGPDNATVVTSEGGVVLQDFYLTAGYLEADPINLMEDVVIGSTATVSFDLNNLGGEDGMFEIIMVGGGFTPTTIRGAYEGLTSNVPWLSVDPTSGTVPAEGTLEIELTLDAGISEITEPGLYHAILQITNDTPYESLDVPVTMNVIPSPTLKVTVSHNLESSHIPGQSTSYPVEVKNLGNVPDTYTLALSGGEWLAELDLDSISLAPGETGMVYVTVHIPDDARMGDWDKVTFQATSVTDTDVFDECQITTTAEWAPVAGFTFLPESPLVNQTVLFTNTTVGTGYITYAWDFGDGATSFGKNTSHIYIGEGVYTVTLVATNAFGIDTHTAEIEVLVEPRLFLPLINRQ